MSQSLELILSMNIHTIASRITVETTQDVSLIFVEAAEYGRKGILGQAITSPVLLQNKIFSSKDSSNQG